MKRIIIFIVLFAISISVSSLVVFAEVDGKVYPGTGCHPDILWEGEQVIYSGGHVRNLAGSKWFECPVIHDLIDGDINLVQVSVIDNHPTRNITCRFYDANALSRYWYYSPYYSGSSRGSSPDIQIINIKPSSYTSGPRYYFLRCLVPEYSDGLSEIVNYYVEEER